MAYGRHIAAARFSRSTRRRNPCLPRSTIGKWILHRTQFMNYQSKARFEMTAVLRSCFVGVIVLFITRSSISAENNAASLPKAGIDGTGLGWVALGFKDF